MKRVLADGSGRVEEIGQGVGGVVSRDGHIFYVVVDQRGLAALVPVPDERKREARAVSAAGLLQHRGGAVAGRTLRRVRGLGPDQSDPEVFLRRFPPSEGVWQVSTGGGTSPRWSADGRLFFAKGPDIYEATVTADPDVRVGTPALVFKRTVPSGGSVPSAFDVAPDGKHFLVYELAGEAPDDRMTVTLNWFGDLRAGAGAGRQEGSEMNRRFRSLRSLTRPRHEPPPSLRSGDYSHRELMREGL